LFCVFTTREVVMATHSLHFVLHTVTRAAGKDYQIVVFGRWWEWFVFCIAECAVSLVVLSFHLFV
jgi:hypothetical protein